MSGPIGKIYTWQGHHRGNRPRVVAALAGLGLTFVPVEQNVTSKTPDYLAKFPTGLVPGFEGADGFTLSESSAISKYIASLAPNSGLLGTDAKEAALIDQWVSYFDSEIDPARKTLTLMFANKLQYTKPVEVTLRANISETLERINSYLSSRTFIVGHRITVADVALATLIERIFATIYGKEERAKVPNVVRHFETIANNPKAKVIFGDYAYAEKSQQYTPPAKEKKAPIAAAVAAVKEKITPKKAAKEEEHDDADDEPAVQEPKAKNPLDDLPKSSLNLEDWKRAYSNMDTRGPNGSLEWFYQKYDPEGYSLWQVKFKYNEELTQTFMSANQIGGFYNRLEGSRKYLFGSMGVLGTNNNSLIEGVLIARGQEIKPVVDVAPDWESYTYEKIDLKNPEQKAYFEAALAWDLEVGDKKWVDGKNFK